MNRNFVVSLILLFILIVIIATGCNQAKTSIARDISLMETITESKNSINVSVDPRIELLSIVQILSNYPEKFPTLITKEKFDYKDKVMDYFSEFKEHKAIKTLEGMMPDFSYDVPPGLMLFMDKNFNVREDVELTEYIIERADGKNNINELFESLKEFCIDTNFIDFFNDNSNYYNRIINSTLELIPSDCNIIEDLEEYYGMKRKSYNVVLVSLYGNGAFGPNIDTKEDDTEIYSVLGCIGIDMMDLPMFGGWSFFTGLQQHEFSHSFINPITDKNYNLAYSYEELFIPIKGKMRSMAYTNWGTCLNEHIIRALTSRFAYHEDNLDGIRALEMEKETGFIYVETLFNKLEEYENNRDKYSTIEDFYPELLKSLDEFMDKN
ncbi:DUF4932 domain-containing protein [Tissierella carlieri]|uniref:DUF4932 domain-containing protein n=1 Tax=Tissierella carlieri TaxID=689904 RepID=UPI0038656017